jgi:hypothetical protein
MYRWERRDKKLEKRKKKMPQSGKDLGKIYRDATEKRLKELNDL